MPIPDERYGRQPADQGPRQADSSTTDGEPGEGTHWLPDGTSVVALVRERGGERGHPESPSVSRTLSDEDVAVPFWPIRFPEPRSWTA